MPAFLGMIPWGKLIMAALFAAMGAYIAHKVDTLYYTAKVAHVETQLADEKAARADDVRKALVWATEKQREYDDLAIHAAQTDTELQTKIARDAEERARQLAAMGPRVLVRGCLTYEFVRQLDAAVIANGPASALRLPSGKSSDTCAPVTAVDVVRWLLGIIETARANGQQLDDLIAFVRAAQAAR